MTFSRWQWATTLFACMIAAGPARAGPVFKCRTDAGTVSYSSVPCRPGTRLEDRLDFTGPAPSPGAADAPSPPPTAEQQKASPAAATARDWEAPPGPAGGDDTRPPAARPAAPVESADKAPIDPRSTLRCIEIRRRLPGLAMSEGCL